MEENYKELLEKFKVISMAAGSNAVLFSEQVNKFKPKIACLTNPENIGKIVEIPAGTDFYYGENALLHAVTDECDIVFDAVMGYAGLKAVKYAIELKKNVALANKETLVAKGLVKNSAVLVKVLGNGDLTKKVTVAVDKVSGSAKEKIEAAGGKTEVV